MYHVLASTASPPFIVMSYRRACYVCQKHKESKDNITECQCEGEFKIHETTNTTNAPPVSIASIRVIDGYEAKPPPTATTSHSSSITRPLQALYAFMAIPPAHFFSGQLESIHSRLLKSYLQPLAVSLGFNAYQKRSMTVPPLMRPVSSLQMTSSCLHPDIESLKSICLDLVLSAVTFEAMTQNHRAFTSYTHTLLDRSALFETYEEWMLGQYALFNTRLLPLQLTLEILDKHIRYASTCVDALADVRAYLKKLDTITVISQTDTSYMFEYFVAQLREVYMVQPISKL